MARKMIGATKPNKVPWRRRRSDPLVEAAREISRNYDAVFLANRVAVSPRNHNGRAS